MKRETLKHPKTFDLASRLGCDRARALGILTLLWDFTADMAIQGDVGKWPNGAIARACDWLEDPDAFVDALVESGWVDISSNYRLLIHDWPDHCERWIRAKMKKLGLEFATDYDATVVDTTETTDVQTVETTPPRDQTKPNQTKPNPPPPTPSQGSNSSFEGEPDWAAVEDALLEAGVLRAADAAETARDRGCSAGRVLELVAFWRSKRPAWDCGALLERIGRFRDHQDLGSLWPTPAKAFELAENSAKRLEVAENAAMLRVAAISERDADFERIQCLEGLYGPQVDAMSTDEIRAAILEHLEEGPAKLLLKKLRRPPTGMLRTELLEHCYAVAERLELVSEDPQ